MKDNGRTPGKRKNKSGLKPRIIDSTRTEIKDILDAFPFYVLLLDSNHHILMANDAVQTDLGKKPDQIIGGFCPRVIHGTDKAIPHCPLEEVVVQGHSIEREFFDCNRNRWVSSAVYPTMLLTPDGKKVYLHMTFDIDARKRAENSLMESYEKLRKITGSITEAITITVEKRDPYTAGHQQRVTELACEIASEMGLAEDQVEGIRVAGLVHDIGKIVVPIEILSKPGKLSNDELNIIKSHSQVGFEILNRIDFPWPVAQIVHQHHERLNGSGYPKKLKNKNILLESKIISVSDVVEAMASYRPYRQPLGINKALEEISQNKGILYDSKVVETCVKLFMEKGFKFTYS